MENTDFRYFGVMLDNSRNAVMKPEAVKKYIDVMAKLGYNCLMLYTEDTYEIKGHPYFGHNRGRYTQEEIKDLDKYASERGIELMPCIQTLAHLNAIFHWDEYKKIRDCNDILLAQDQGTYKLIEDMFDFLAQNFTSRTVNIGMDEADMLGKGKFMDKNGVVDRFDILLNHLRKVSEIAAKHGFRLAMWSDMFFRLLSDGDYLNNDIQVDEKLKALIPENVDLIYWDYYHITKEHYDKQIKMHRKLKDNIWFAGGLWGWVGFTPNNKYSINATQKAFESCKENGVKDVIMTIWGDDGAECSKFALLPSLYYSACLAKGITDENAIKDGFFKEFGIKFDDFMLLDLKGTACDSFEAVNNSSKYLLYNDCFMGLFDNCVTQEEIEAYKNLIKPLSEISDNSEYGYLFKTAEKLCKAVAAKGDLGLKTRKAYEAKDKEALEALLNDYDYAINAVEELYDAFEKQWMTDNKPHGFDVQDIRLGGLVQRIKHCKKRLERFINGEISSIEELEAPLLDPLCRKEDAGKPLCFNVWRENVTSNVI